jgi:hypothetical protein
MGNGPGGPVSGTSGREVWLYMVTEFVPDRCRKSRNCCVAKTQATEHRERVAPFRNRQPGK